MNDYSKITALYYRLSVGDEDRDGGESGRFFDRSAYFRMIEDVENGKIGVCIMIDMTRWGRNYLQLGNAMEIFRFDGITHGYTHKGSVVHTEILLPDHVPAQYADRAVL